MTKSSHTIVFFLQITILFSLESSHSLLQDLFEMKFRYLILVSFLSFVRGQQNQETINFEQNCLTGNPLINQQKAEKLQYFFCTTSKNVIIEKIITDGKTYYCIKYEKKTGTKDDYDVIEFGTHGEFELNFVSL